MQDWVSIETEYQLMGDERLNKRLAKILHTLSIDPAKSIPCANDTWAETIGAYRFFDNDTVNFEAIMSGHKSATIDRISKQPVVLIPQDTTFLNFATESESKDMGTLRTKDSNQQLLHTSIAITPGRLNLGVVEGSLWQRPEKMAGKSRAIKPIEEKESMRWLNHYDTACEVQAQCPETLVISIADREGDIHEWFQRAESVDENSRASYIVRAKANRKIELENGGTSALWDYMNSLKKVGKYSVNVPKRNGEPGRNASIDVATSEVHFLGKGTKRQPLSLHVVYAKERNPPAGTKGIEWMLLTDLNVEGFEQARMIIEWYRCRWEIETYFRVVKGGCLIQNNRFRTEERMFNCIAVYMIIGWRLHSITMMARKEPDRPCSDLFTKQEWTLIWIMKEKTKPPETAPGMREITRMLAGLGGFLGRKGDGEPGVKTVWEGYRKLLNYIEASELVDSVKSYV